MELKLPTILATKQDITRVQRELRLFNDSAQQSVMRHDKSIKYPEISESLKALATENQINLHDETACKHLSDKLGSLHKNAPVLHISFAVDPPVEVVQKLIVWFREEIDPKIVIQIGLQPTIAAGIVLRTPNKQFDFSLRQHLYGKRDKLKEALSV